MATHIIVAERMGRHMTSVTVRGAKLNNGWVVPFVTFLILCYKCHINVELAFGVRGIKYIHKYVYKGHDRTTMELEEEEENKIKQYLDARYVGAYEAVWRVMGHEICHELTIFTT